MEQLVVVRRTCLHIATKLGDLLDEIVVVGGLVPYLLVDQENLPSGVEPYPGTMDLDMGLALEVLNRERYRELAVRLSDAGFEPEVNERGNRRLQTWRARTPHRVTVDFLIPDSGESGNGGTLLHIESDLAAIITPGLELAFKDQRRMELSDHTFSGAWATRTIPVCGPGAFTVLKALAFANRGRDKDAYDLFYVWSGVGVSQVAESLASLPTSAYVDAALQIIERDFSNHDGSGPTEAALFIAQEPDDNVQADVVGHAHRLLRLLRRR